MVINLHQPSAISHCAKYNTVPLTSLIPLCRALGPRQTVGPYTPTCLPNLYGSHHPLHHSAVQIHFDMPPNASMDIIKRRNLLGKPLGKYTCTLILSQACTIGHIPLQQPVGLFANCVWLEYVTLLIALIRQPCLDSDKGLFHTNCLPFSLSLPTPFSVFLPPALTMLFPVVSLCPYLSVFLSFIFLILCKSSTVHSNETELFQPKGHKQQAELHPLLTLLCPGSATASSLARQLMTCKRLNWGSAADLELLY